MRRRRKAPDAITNRDIKILEARIYLDIAERECLYASTRVKAASEAYREANIRYQALVLEAME